VGDVGRDAGRGGAVVPAPADVAVGRDGAPVRALAVSSARLAAMSSADGRPDEITWSL